MGKVILALVILATLVGCNTTGGNFCDVARPVRPESVASIATMTDAEVEAIIAHNEKGAKLCGWRP